jgi:hypothetical protein
MGKAGRGCVGVPICCFVGRESLLLLLLPCTLHLAGDSSILALSLICDTFFSLLTQAFSISVNLCTPSSSPLATISLLSPPSPRRLLSLFAFASLFLSPFDLFLYARPSITWLRQYDSQSRPRRAFPVIILLPGSPSPFPPSPLPFAFLPSLLAARPPGAERVLLRPFLPAPIMPVSPTALPPPPLLKPCLSLLSVLRHLLLARITKSFFRILRVSPYVSFLVRPSLLVRYLSFSLKRARQSPSSPRPGNAMRVPSLLPPKAKATQLV